MESRIKITEYGSNPEWNQLEIEQRWSTWSVSMPLSDNEVEISCESSEGNSYLYLNQQELREFIAFLQTKVKQ